MIHIHWYKKVSDNPDYRFYGMVTRRRKWRCRCGALKLKMHGPL